MSYSLKDKTVVVTGGTDGMGAAAALAFVKQGAAKVVIIGRSASKGQAIVDKVAAQFEDSTKKNPMVFVQADFESLKVAKSVAMEKFKDVDQVDVLVNCVGVASFEAQVTKEGLPRSFAINFLSRFVFLEAMSNLNKLHPKTILFNVSAAKSNYPVENQVDFDSVEQVEARDGLVYANQTQSANDLMAVFAAKRYNIATIAYGPGFVKTGITREMTGWRGWVAPIVFYIMGRKPEQVADHWMTLLKEGTHVAGETKFYHDLDRESFPVVPYIDDTQRQQQLLDIALTMSERALND